MHSFKIKNLKLKIILALLFVLITSNFSLIAPKAHAATLGMSSDTISTSRPSASSVLLWNQPAASTSAILFDNGSIFLASDSAKFHPNPDQTFTIASMSAAYSSSPTKRLVSFTSGVTASHNKGHALIVPITAAHTIQFTTINAIPVNGEIALTFPALTTGDANNPASPSATTFQLNNIAAAQIMLVDNGTTYGGTYTVTTTNPSNGTSPIIRLRSLDTTIAANRTVTILLGCTAQSSAVCTTQAPLIINPSKTAVPGVADQSTSGWTVKIDTIDTAQNVTLDTGRAKIGTVDSVFVSATVDPSLTFTISGVAGGASLGSACGSDTTTAGIGTTANIVDLGTLSSSTVTIAAQQLSVTTNAQFGYVITATSSGRFINPANGFYLNDANPGDGLTANDTPAPIAFPAAGTPTFGIAPCGTRVPTSSPDWDDELAIGSAGNGGAKASNPWSSQGTKGYNAKIATYSGPIGVASDTTTIRYAATVASTTPAGLYSTTFTYVVTPTF